MSALAWVNDYVGVPHVAGGTDREGWDCWGLVRSVYREQRGIELPDWRVSEPFGLTAKYHAFADAIAQVQRENSALELDGPELWAIGLIGGAPHHAGVCAGSGVLHTARYGGTLHDPLPRFLASYPRVRWWRWLA